MAQLEHITPDQIAQYGVVAAPDRLTGRAQDNKAIFDRLVRELVALVVNDIIDRTNELLIAEDTREENEADRIAAENLRVQAENLRVQAENIRVENEQSRVQAESARVAAELLRVQAENLRASAENARNTAETAREEAEARRESTTNGIVVRATQQAEAAEQSATRASNFEQEAAGYSRSAAESAASASQSASNAAQSAQGAGNSAGSAEASANAALQAVNRYPRINLSTMTWFLWDPEKGEFVDTGVIAEGRNGIEADGLWGVYVDEEGFLVVTYTGDDPPPLSISDDGYLVYTLNGQEIRVGKVVSPDGLPPAEGLPDGYTLQTLGGEAVWGESAGGSASGALPLVVDFTLDEEASLITISQDKDGNPLNLTEFAVFTRLYGGANNGDGASNRSEALMYFNGVNTAVGRTNLGTVVGAAGLSVEYSFYAKKLEYGAFMAYQDGYDYANTNSINTIRYINGAEKNFITKYPTITSLTFYINDEAKTFGVGSRIVICGR